MALPEITYIKRRNQKYLRIRVKPGSIVVSAPFYATSREIKRFVDEKSDWLQSTYSQLMRKHSKVDLQNRFDEGFLLFRGEWYPVDVSLGRPTGKFSFGDGIFRVQLKGDSKDPEAVGNLYREFAAPLLADFFYDTARKHGFTFRNLVIRNQRTKWGSCSQKGNINLNWRLIKCPEFVQKYIFIHELCHTVHMNHSKAYWQLVERHFPERKLAEKWIRENGALAFRDP